MCVWLLQWLCYRCRNSQTPQSFQTNDNHEITTDSNTVTILHDGCKVCCCFIVAIYIIIVAIYIIIVIFVAIYSTTLSILTTQ